MKNRFLNKSPRSSASTVDEIDNIIRCFRVITPWNVKKREIAADKLSSLELTVEDKLYLLSKIKRIYKKCVAKTELTRLLLQFFKIIFPGTIVLLSQYIYKRYYSDDSFDVYDILYSPIVLAIEYAFISFFMLPFTLVASFYIEEVKAECMQQILYSLRKIATYEYTELLAESATKKVLREYALPALSLSLESGLQNHISLDTSTLLNLCDVVDYAEVQTSQLILMLLSQSDNLNVLTQVRNLVSQGTSLRIRQQAQEAVERILTNRKLSDNRLQLLRPSIDSRSSSDELLRAHTSSEAIHPETLLRPVE